jgi:hypothetical protein
MNERTKQGIKILEAALLLGILGDGLLRAMPLGLNVLLWTGGVVVAMVVLLMRWRRRVLLDGGHWLLLLAILSAAAFAWRDSLTLNFLAGMTLLVALSLMAWRARGGRIWLAGIAEYMLGILVAGINAIFVGFPSLFFDVRWKEVTAAGWTRHLRSVLIGLVIALPLLLVFGTLLVSADAIFQGMVNRLFSANHEEAFGHIFLALTLAWIAGGFLRGLLFGREVKVVGGRARLVSLNLTENCVLGNSDVSNEAQTAKPKALSLGIVEIGIMLGLLNLLFFVFVLLQLRYFFGGAALVHGSDGLTYAEYYRRGFFELVTVAALVLPLLLAAHWLLRKEKLAHERIFRVLAGTQVVLLFVIMVSAVRRMLLYQSEYGLTELRLYTTAFMCWLALVFIWFVATVLRGRREQFAFGSLVAGLLMIATLHVINPDAFIVRVNVAHARAGRSFDVHYAVSLSDDAVPTLMKSLPALSATDQRIIAAKVLERLSPPEVRNWRTWNWSRAEAQRVIQEEFNTLRDITQPPQDIERVTESAETHKAQGVEDVNQAKPVVERARTSPTRSRK